MIDFTITHNYVDVNIKVGIMQSFKRFGISVFFETINKAICVYYILKSTEFHIEHETYEDFLTLCDKIVEMQSSLLYKFRVLKCNKTLYALYIMYNKILGSVWVLENYICYKEFLTGRWDILGIYHVKYNW